VNRLLKTLVAVPALLIGVWLWQRAEEGSSREWTNEEIDRPLVEKVSMTKWSNKDAALFFGCVSGRIGWTITFKSVPYPYDWRTSNTSIVLQIGDGQRMDYPVKTVEKNGTGVLATPLVNTADRLARDILLAKSHVDIGLKITGEIPVSTRMNIQKAADKALREATVRNCT
jgi:hypothetical protein